MCSVYHERGVSLVSREAKIDEELGDDTSFNTYITHTFRQDCISNEKCYIPYIFPCTLLLCCSGEYCLNKERTIYSKNDPAYMNEDVKVCLLCRNLVCCKDCMSDNNFCFYCQVNYLCDNQNNCIDFDSSLNLPNWLIRKNNNWAENYEDLYQHALMSCKKCQKDVCMNCAKSGHTDDVLNDVLCYDCDVGEGREYNSGLKMVHFKSSGVNPITADAVTADELTGDVGGGVTGDADNSDDVTGDVTGDDVTGDVGDVGDGVTGDVVNKSVNKDVGDAVTGGDVTGNADTGDAVTGGVGKSIGSSKQSIRLCKEAAFFQAMPNTCTSIKLKTTTDVYRKNFKHSARSSNRIKQEVALNVPDVQIKVEVMKSINAGLRGRHETNNNISDHFLFHPTYKSIGASFSCTMCSHYSRSSIMIPVEVYDKPSILNFRNNTHIMFTTELVGAICDLITHVYHNRNKLLVHCLTPNNIFTEYEMIKLPKYKQQILLCAHTSMHYSVLNINLENYIITVSDGLFYPANYWREHIIHILLKYRIVDKQTPDDNYLDVSGFKSMSEVFSGEAIIKKQFILQRNINVIQGDDLTCGPHACYEIYSLYAEQNGPILSDGEDKRKFIMDEYSRLIKQGEDDDWLRVRHQVRKVNLYDNQGAFNANGEQLGIVLDHTEAEIREICQMCGLSSSADVDIVELNCCHQFVHRKCIGIGINQSVRCILCHSLLSILERKVSSSAKQTTPSKQQIMKPQQPSALVLSVKEYKAKVESSKQLIGQRNNQMTQVHIAKKQSNQKKQASTMQKRYDNSVQSLQYELGDAVRIKVPKNARNRTNSSPVIGIIYKLTRTNLPYIVSLFGVVGTSKKRPSTTKLSEFDRIYEKASLGETLNNYRTFIKSEAYEPKLHFTYNNKQLPVLPLSSIQAKYSPKEYQSAHRCDCKSECTSKTCTCRIFNTVCGPGCKCKGKCTHTIRKHATELRHHLKTGEWLRPLDSNQQSSSSDSDDDKEGEGKH
jgi:hypothetical protein